MPYSYYYWGFDPTYILVLIGAVICLVASARVKSTYNKYASYRSMSGMTGAQAAERILHSAGIYDVSVQHVSGNLTDHYNPSNKTLNLSDSVYGSTSVAAVGVAAHECGHAIQHAHGYAPMSIRAALVPVVNIGSNLSIPLIFLGVLLSWNQTLIQLGIWAFALTVIFQLVTLPVEFNASHRAIVKVEEYGLLGSEEVSGGKKVLTAAALTYVAGAASAILQLLRIHLTCIILSAFHQNMAYPHLPYCSFLLILHNQLTLWTTLLHITMHLQFSFSFSCFSSINRTYIFINHHL